MNALNEPAAELALPVMPPVQPMLARLSRTLPTGDLLYEPKWDGFRCLAFRSGATVDLRSRNDRPLARYFPEIAAAIAALPGTAAVLDGEIMVLRDGVADFETLLARLHPAASRATELSQRTPASYVAFDLLATADSDLRDTPFVDRRAVLSGLIADVDAPVSLTPITPEETTAAEWLRRSVAGGGIDGVIAKARDLTYQQGRRAMVKVKTERTADCVVAGARVFDDPPGGAHPPGVASLLLALYDEAGALRHVGVASSFPQARRRELLDDIAPAVVALQEHPWRDGFGADTGRVAKLPGAATRWTPEMTLDWVPLRPELVCEVAYEHVDNGLFRHPARFRRWRPDRTAESCHTTQLHHAGDAVIGLPT